MIEPKEYKGRQGVYMIVQPDGQYYIGSSIELYNRLRAHKTYLNPKAKNYRLIKYTCEWNELSVYILKYTIGLSQKQLKSLEQKYLDIYWSDSILNTERKSSGRSISKSANPNWIGGRCDDKICECGSIINYRSSHCRSCSTKKQHKINRDYWRNVNDIISKIKQ